MSPPKVAVFGDKGDSRSILRVHGDLGAVRDIAHLLKTLENAYNGVTAFDLHVETIASYPPTDLWPSFFYYPSLFSYDPSSYLSERHVLLLLHAQFGSQGFWDFLGRTLSLEAIGKFINERHERRKDNTYRIQNEKRHMELENEQLELDNFQRKINILREAGLPRPIIENTVRRFITEPLNDLEKEKDTGLLGPAELIRRDQAPEE